MSCRAFVIYIVYLYSMHIRIYIYHVTSYYCTYNIIIHIQHNIIYIVLLLSE